VLVPKDKGKWMTLSDASKTLRWLTEVWRGLDGKPYSPDETWDAVAEVRSVEEARRWLGERDE
jgi:hypothetical protein